MRITPPTIAIIASLLLIGCTSTATTPKATLEQELKNPLVAARYGDMLADTLANLIITKSKTADKPETRAAIDSGIERGKTLGSDARAQIAMGTKGTFVSDTLQILGFVLFLKNHVYLSSEFDVNPGPDLHLYLTQVNDPRDIAFPDAKAIDLGELSSAYGAQTFDVPTLDKPEQYRTAVLWDKKLKLLYGFSQLSK